MSGTTSSSKKFNLFWAPSLLFALAVIIAIFVVVSSFTSGPSNTKGEYHLGYSTLVDGLPSGIYMVCESEPCRRTGFAEWIRLDSSVATATVTVQVENTSKAQAYAEVDANGFLVDPLTTSINGDYVTIALPNGQTSFLLWVTTTNNDPYGIVE